MKASSDKELEREVVNLFGVAKVEGSMGVVETFNESVSDRVSDSLVAMGLLEVESGPGECILDMVDNSKSKTIDTIFEFLGPLWGDRRPSGDVACRSCLYLFRSWRPPSR